MNVIFDTNPYRYLASGKTPEQVKVTIEKLRKAEERQGVHAWVAPTVWLELFYHVGGPVGRNYDDCLSAVVACYLHTRSGETNQYSLAPRAGMLQAHTLFDHKDEQEDDLLRTMDYIAGEIVKNPARATVEKYGDYFRRYREFVLNEESAFMKRFEKEKKRIYKDDPLESMYLGLAKMVATHLGMKPHSWTEAEREELTKKVEVYFPAPFQLYLEIRKRCIENPGIDIRTRSKRNWYWDHDMLFYINKKLNMLLVTDDKAMRTAAKNAGLEEKAKRLTDYLSDIKVDLDQLRN